MLVHHIIWEWCFLHMTWPRKCSKRRHKYVWLFVTLEEAGSSSSINNTIHTFFQLFCSYKLRMDLETSHEDYIAMDGTDKIQKCVCKKALLCYTSGPVPKMLTRPRNTWADSWCACKISPSTFHTLCFPWEVNTKVGVWIDTKAGTSKLSLDTCYSRRNW